MFHTVMRQRRRFAFALILTQVALYGVWPQYAILAFMVLGIGAGFVLVAASGHPLRRLIECGSIGVLACSRMPTPTLIAAAFVGATGLAYIVLYSRLLDQCGVRIGLHSKKTFDVNLDRRTTWNKLIPGQGHPAAYWTGSMLSARPDPQDEDTLYVTFQTNTAEKEEITITYLAMKPHVSAKYLIERDTLLAGEELIMTYRLEVVADEATRIHSDMHVSGLPIRHAVERFFDDVLGDELDSFATMTSCKRIWRRRPNSDVDLTSELGTETGVFALKDTPETETTTTAPDQKKKTRLSA